MNAIRPRAAFGFTLFAMAFASVARFEPEPRSAHPSAEQIEAAVSYAHATAGLQGGETTASR